MGAIMSQRPTKSSKATELDRKVLEALRHRSEQPDRARTMNRILLKGTKVAIGFKAVRTSFSAIDKDNSGFIDPDEFAEAARSLHVKLPADVLDSTMFDASDLSRTGLLPFREFIIAAVTCHLLEADPEASDFATAADVVTDAWLICDLDLDGSITRKELNMALSTTSTDAGARRHSRIGPGGLAERFQELDFDRSGRISFAEFCFSFHDWIAADEDGEEVIQPDAVADKDDTAPRKTPR